MTISTSVNRYSYTGNGVTTAFAYNSRFLADGDLVVLLVTTLTGASVTKVLTTDYTVSGAGAASGGTITMLVAPASTESLVIYGDPAITQSTDWVENDPDSAEVKETAFDRLTLICARFKDLVSRSAKLADSDVSGASVILPTPTANQFLAWNSTATGLINATNVIAVTVSTFWSTVLVALTAAASRALLLIEARATVAATATTTPLWAEGSMVQDWTGTPTITNFPAAPQAGAWRRVYPAAGTVFTDNANIDVQGDANYTVIAGDQIYIEALTTTTFKALITKKNGTAVVSTAVNDNNSTYRTIHKTINGILAGVTADTFNLPASGAPSAFTNASNGVGGTNSVAVVALYIAAADYPTVGTLTTKMRVRVELFVNDTAPSGNFTVGLYPITRPGTTGAAGNQVITLGTVVPGSTVAFTTPAADSMLHGDSGDFAIPADGHYVLGLVTTTTVNANSRVDINATLQVHNT